MQKRNGPGDEKLLRLFDAHRWLFPKCVNFLRNLDHPFTEVALQDKFEHITDGTLETSRIEDVRSSLSALFREGYSPREAYGRLQIPFPLLGDDGFPAERQSVDFNRGDTYEHFGLIGLQKPLFRHTTGELQLVHASINKNGVAPSGGFH